MIKDFVSKKASRAIESSSLGGTAAGQAAATYLDAEKRGAKSAADIASVTDEMQHSYFRRRIILIALFVNIVSWVGVLLLTGVVSKLALGAGLIFSKGGLLLVAPAFSGTMLGIYALFRILYPSLESTEADESAVMQSFNRSEESLKAWRVWVVSCGIAAINSILLVGSYLYMNGEWQQFAK